MGIFITYHCYEVKGKGRSSHLNGFSLGLVVTSLGEVSLVLGFVEAMEVILKKVLKLSNQHLHYSPNLGTSSNQQFFHQ